MFHLSFPIFLRAQAGRIDPADPAVVRAGVGRDPDLPIRGAPASGRGRDAVACAVRSVPRLLPAATRPAR